MNSPRVLIVEDEVVIALELQAITEDIADAICVLKASSVSAKKAASSEHFDLALLDIDVLNGNTFDVVRLLRKGDVPCVFVSSASQRLLPLELRQIPFIAKPFRPDEIERAVRAALG